MPLERFYNAAPAMIQNLALSAYGWRLARRRYGPGYPEVESRVMAREGLAGDALEQFCLGRLREVLGQAVRQIPYYKDLFRRVGFDPRALRCLDDLAALPVLSRPQAQAHMTALRHPGWQSMSSVLVKTSGTTGTGLVFPVTLSAEREQWAVWWRYRRRFGLDRQTWYAHFYGRSVVPVSQDRPPFWRVNWPGRQILFSGYHLQDRHMGSYVDELNRRQPPWIQGYPSLLALLAGYMLARGRRLDYQPRAVTVGSESLLPQQKQLIEAAFGVTCRQHYGSTESVANISECPAGRLHVDEDFGRIEFLPNDDGSHRIVATGYANEAFVLIRYELGDNVTLPPPGTICNCGLPGRIVERIDGRIEDYVITPRGAYIGRLDHIFKDIITVREAQIVQENVGFLEIRVVPGTGFDAASLERIMAEARARLGPDMEIRIRTVESLERSRTGKLRFVISRLQDGSGRLERAGRDAASEVA